MSGANIPMKRSDSESCENFWLSDEILQKKQLYASEVEHCTCHKIFRTVRQPMFWNVTSIVSTENASVTPEAILYQPLAPFQIRILHIEPGVFDEPLKTSLCLVDLLLEGGVVDPVTRKLYTYEAVSYSWDDHGKGGFVYCDNRIVNLRESQYMLLKFLRHRSQSCCVWLDTMCINQDDNAQSAMQVGKMFTIFKHAQCVLI